MPSFKEQVAELVVEALNFRDRLDKDESPWSVSDMEIEDVEVTWTPDTTYGSDDLAPPEFMVKVDYRTSFRGSGTVGVDVGAYLTILSRKMLVWGS